MRAPGDRSDDGANTRPHDDPGLRIRASAGELNNRKPVDAAKQTTIFLKRFRTSPTGIINSNGLADVVKVTLLLPGEWLPNNERVAVRSLSRLSFQQTDERVRRS